MTPGPTGPSPFFSLTMKFNELCIDTRDGSDAAWDAIQNWLASYELDVPPGTEQAINDVLQEILDSTDVRRLK